MKRIPWVCLCILVAASVGSAQSVLYFPQIADGIQPGGIQWGMAVFIVNQGSGTASGTLKLTKDDGTPLSVTARSLTGATVTADTFPFQLGAGQVTGFVTGGESGNSTAALSTGFATINSNLPVGGGIVFSEVSPTGRIAEAGVAPATPVTGQSIIALAPSALNSGAPTTGVALANPSNATANITFQLLDPTGAIVATTTKTLAGNNHTALFVNQLFPNAVIGGTMRILSDVPLAATSLLFENNGQFATIPVFPLP